MTNVRITGQNFLYAIGIAFLFVLVISTIFALMSAAANAIDPQNASGIGFARVFVNTLYGGLLCWGAPVFIASFALLQRFRVKKQNYDDRN